MENNKQNQFSIEAYTNNEGEKFVHIVAGKYNFLLDINNLCEDEKNWNDAMNLAKERNRQLPTKEMWNLISAFLPEINQVITDLGGSPLNTWYWASSQCNGNLAWMFYAISGFLDIYNLKMYASSVRGSLAFNS